MGRKNTYNMVHYECTVGLVYNCHTEGDKRLNNRNESIDTHLQFHPVTITQKSTCHLANNKKFVILLIVNNGSTL